MVLTRKNILIICFLHFFVQLIHFRITDAYGDLNGLDEGNFTDFLYGAAWPQQEHHRVRRVAGVNSTDSSTEATATVTSSTSNGIYIITSFADPNLSSTLTTVVTTQQTTEMTSTYSTSIYVGIYVVSGLSSITTQSSTVITSTPTTVTTASTLPPAPTTTPCNLVLYFITSNGSCVLRQAEQNRTLSILNNNSSNSTELANALVQYTEATANTSGTTSHDSLSFQLIDSTIERINTSLFVNSTQAVVVSTVIDSFAPDPDKVVGATFRLGSGGTSVYNGGRITSINQVVSAAGVFSNQTIQNASSMAIFVIGDPKPYLNADQISGSVPVSSIVTARITFRPGAENRIIFLLYLTVTSNQTSANGNISCAFFDTDTNQWNKTGCNAAKYNSLYERYECECYHLTSFALIWLPPNPQRLQDPPDPKKPPILEPTDIASIVFQSVSIVCFLGVVIHSLVTRAINPLQCTGPQSFLSLIASLMTVITFIFYIAAGLTVFTRFQTIATTTTTTTITTTMMTSTRSTTTYGEGRAFPLLENRATSSNDNTTNSTQESCLSNESNLAFTFYFFLLLMFAAKLSAIYLNYEHYVKFEISNRWCKIVTAVIISVLIPLIFVIVASALHSNPANNIMAIVQQKLCWFTSEKNHFFLTLPICLFCSIMIILTLLIFKKAIAYRKLDRQYQYRSPHAKKIRDYQTRHRRRRHQTAIVLLVSGLLQTLIWISGPLLAIDNPTSAAVLHWLFIIFNGLEGLWTLLLYIIIRRDGLDKSPPGNRYVQQDDPSNWPKVDINLDDDADRDHFETPVLTFDGIIEKGSESGDHSYDKMK